MRSIRSLLREPLAWILMANVVLHGVGIGWGLPSSTGWDDDGVAPRDFLVGVVETYQWGSHYTYPPLHLLMLTALTAPVWVTALIRARGFGVADLIAEFTKIPYMTAFSVIARAVSVAMGVGIVYAIFRLVEEIWGRRAGICAALVVTTNVVLNYYSHTSNLDVPYLFWASLAIVEAVRVVTRAEPRRLRRFAWLAAFSICTKDQAYGLFVLSVPAILIAWVATGRSARGHLREVARESAIALLVATMLVMVIDGALFNPPGFRARLAFLTGTASQDHAVYPADVAGWAAIAKDTLSFFGRYYSWPVAALCVLGFGKSLCAPRSARFPVSRVASLAPMAVAVSFTLAFNMSARRTEHRFLLPQMLMFGVYAGVGVDWLVFRSDLQRFYRPAVAALLAWGMWRAAAVNKALLCDPRYDAEAWMQSNMRPGDRVETYGNDVYLPRFPLVTDVQRVGPESLSGRSSLPGVREVKAAYSDVEERRPRFVVLSQGWAWRYLADTGSLLKVGTSLSPEQSARERDSASQGYFRALLEGRLHYRLVHMSAHRTSLFPVVDIHSSTNKTVWILERVDDSAPDVSRTTES